MILYDGNDVGTAVTNSGGLALFVLLIEPKRGRRMKEEEEKRVFTRLKIHKASAHWGGESLALPPEERDIII